jgi:hypothetical protein
MRLLNTNTLTLHEFFDNAIPNYAILSHRWESEEVTFQDLQGGRASSMKGFSKIEGCCQQAASDGWEFAWIDSCCIDKTSSSELSEAINSMFKWYQNSQVCYAYLSDVPAGLNMSRHLEKNSSLRTSKWWTRGWTLQELIAPRNVIFYDESWREIGTRTWMAKVISSITGISGEHLRRHTIASVAQRMSWAAKRQMTRVEDGAYCLMGLFDVHMPTLYGEGHKAFLRLQLEILATSDDESLFAWTAPQRYLDKSYPLGLGLLAECPSWFADSNNIVRNQFDDHRPPFSMTNKEVRLEVLAMRSPTNEDLLWVPLNCELAHGNKQVALQLYKFIDNDGLQRTRGLSQQYSAEYTQALSSERLVLFMKQPSDFYYVGDSVWDPFEDRRVEFAIRTESLLKHGFDVIQYWQSDYRTSFSEASDGMTKDYGELKGRKRRTLTIDGSNKWYCLKFKSSRGFVQDTDSFFIVLPVKHPALEAIPSATIMIPYVDQDSIDGDISVLKHIPNRHSDLDRTSKMMESGRSVSVALRRRAGRWMSARSKPLYVVDITIDPQGNLPWPNLS